MAIDPTTGQWQHEDDSTADKVTGMLKSDSPLMQAASGQAMAAANARGLANSSIEAQAGTTAAIDKVLPIASQDSSQAFQKNLSAQGFNQSTSLQGQQIAGQKDVTGMQTGSAERIQSASDQAASARLSAQLGSNERLQAAQAAAQKEQLGMSLTAQEAQDVRDLSAAKERLGMQDETTLKVTNANNATQVQTTGMQINASQSQAVQTNISTVNQTYTAAINNIQNNKDIPADQRAAYITAAGQLRDDSLKLISQVSGTQLSWTTPTAQPKPANTVNTPYGQVNIST